MNTSNYPLYIQIYNSLLDGINTGKYKAGEKVPSEKELVEQFNVSRITAKKALNKLANEGYITRRRGRGSFVAKDFIIDEKFVKNKANVLNVGAPVIGLVITDFSESYGIGLVLGIEDKISELGGYLVLRRSFGEKEKEEEAIQSLLKMGVNGIILLAVQGEHYSNEILRLVLNGFPLVLVDRRLPGIDAAVVCSDNVAAAKKATDYLLDLGHTSIAFLSPPPIDTSTIEDRIDGFIKSHANHGVIVDRALWCIDLTSTLPGHFKSPNIKQDKMKIISMLKSNLHITAIFAVEYNIALIAKEAIQEIGKKIPDDISIICFDGPRYKVGDSFFTHIRQNEEQMGCIAVEILYDQISGKENKSKKLLDVKLVIRASTSKNKLDSS